MAVWMSVFSLVCLLREYTCFTLVVDPPYQQVEPNTKFRFICQADLPLAGCQVKNFVTEEVYDLSEGRLSERYWGTGLETGQCGYTEIAEKSVDRFYTFGCRARSQDGQWQYETLVAHTTADIEDGVLPVVTSPNKMVVDAGDKVTLTYKASNPLSRCRFRWPQQFGSKLNGTNGLYLEDKSSLEQGRCRLTLPNVTTAQSGILVGILKSTSERENVHLTTLLVKQAPNAPVLTLNNDNALYSSGDVMEASCHVGLARPVARITWLLNDDVIQGEAEDFTKEPWDYEAAEVTRKLKRTLTSEDDEKELMCRVHHVTLPGGFVDVKTKITVAGVKASSQVTWLLFGVGGTLLVVAVVVAALLVCARVKRKWCFSSQAKDSSIRLSTLYDDVTAPASSYKNDPDDIYEEIGEVEPAYLVPIRMY